MNAEAIVFWTLALLCVIGSVFVITRRNLVTAVMGMVGTFFAVAVLYVLSSAHFMAAIQVMVYAGAIMVLFVFVVMVLNRPEDEPFVLKGLANWAIVLVPIAYLFWRVADVLWAVSKSVREAAIAGDALPVAQLDPDFGTTRAVGATLFSHYLFPFEAVSIVLLVAVVGAIAISRPTPVDNGSDNNEEATAKS